MKEVTVIPDSIASLTRDCASLFPNSRFSPGKGACPIIAVAGAAHKTTLQSVDSAIKLGLADFLLYGSEAGIMRIADECDLTIPRKTVHDCTDEQACAVAAAKSCAEGRAGVLMKGSVHTSVFSKAFLNKELGLLPEGRIVSHTAMFRIADYHKPFLLTDAALAIDPDFTRKKQILFNACTISRQLGTTVIKAACLGPVETVNPKITSTIDAEQLVILQRETRFFGDGVVVEGPLALDAAMNAESAKIKNIDGEVPGNPDILLLPGLDAANMLYKSFILDPRTLAAGMIAGLRVPVILNSRSDNDRTRLLSLCMALAAAAGEQDIN